MNPAPRPSPESVAAQQVPEQIPTTVELDAAGSPRLDVVRAQLAHLFPGAPFPVHVGYGEPPAGYREVERWRVIPRRESPRFLVPADPAAARRVVVSHNGLRSRRVAATRRLAALAVGPLARLQGERTVLRLSVPAEVDAEAVAGSVITQHLLRQVDGAAGTAISLRDFHPRAKPTVQLLDGAGRVIAFAKVASDEATGQRVLTEADLLRRLGEGLDAARSPLRVPAVRDSGRCGPFTTSIVEPLPDDAQRLRERDEPRVLRAMTAFTEALGPVRQMPLAQTTLWDDVMARLPLARGAATQRPELVEALDRLVALVQRHDAPVTVAAGAYHGDWVPWNMCRVGEVIWAWDLEYGSTTGPVGLDALRWVFQVQHVTGGASFTEAVAEMGDAAARVLPPLGVPVAIAPTLVRLHVVETMTTALGLLATGRGLPGGLDPDAVEVMDLLTAGVNGRVPSPRRP